MSIRLAASGTGGGGGDRPSAADSRGVVSAFGPQGLAVVHASLIDAPSMSCEARWTIADDGSVQDAAPDLDFARSMTTIVCLNRTSGRETMTRQLAPQRWALGWRVDDRRVVVAEVWYRVARAAPSDAETALVRRLCDARVRLVRGNGAGQAEDAVTVPGEFDDRPAERSVRTPLARLRQLSDPEPAAAAPARRPRRRAMLLSALLLMLCLVAALGYVQWRRSEALAAEMQRLQSLAQATLAQSMTAAMERGDYGEVQSELDHFQGLRYFDLALVVNARGQLVAKSDATLGVRIGEPVNSESVAGSRSVELRTANGKTLGRLYVWLHRGSGS